LSASSRHAIFGARRPAFRRNLEDIARRHPELTQLLKERQELQMRYEDSQRRASGRAPRADAAR